MVNQLIAIVFFTTSAVSSHVNQWSSYYFVLVAIIFIIIQPSMTVDAEEIVLVANRAVMGDGRDAASRSVGLSNSRAARLVNNFDDFLTNSSSVSDINKDDEKDLFDYELQLKRMVDYVTPLTAIFSPKHHKQKRWIEFDYQDATSGVDRRRRSKRPLGSKVVRMRVVAVKRQGEGYGGYGGGYSEGCCDFDNYEELLALAALSALLFWLYLIKTTTTTTTTYYIHPYLYYLSKI